MTEKDFKGNAEALDDLRNREENCRHGILDILFYKARYLGLRYDLFLRPKRRVKANLEILVDSAQL